MADDDKKPKAQLLRRADGTILPGQRSNNPGGKPKGVERRIRELVESQMENTPSGDLNGWDAMALAMYDVAMGKRPLGVAEIDIKWKDRADAIRWLYDRVYGKPMVRVETENTTGAGKLSEVDVDKLDLDELAALEAHVELVNARLQGKTGAGRMIDVTPDASLDVDPDPDKVR